MRAVFLLSAGVASGSCSRDDASVGPAGGADGPSQRETPPADAPATACRITAARLAPDDPVSPAGRAVFESPSPGVTLRAPWVPIQVHLPGDQTGGTVELCLDGRALPTPLGILRARNSTTGGGTDFIASLDLNDLEPGPHQLLARARAPSGLSSVARSTFTWDRPAHRVDLEVTDEKGWPVSARVVLTDADGAFVDFGTPDEEATDPHDRDISLHSVFAMGGQATVYLDAGHWRFLAVRSVLDGLGIGEVELSGDATVKLLVVPEVSAPEYLAADLHVHSGRSGDSHIPDDARVKSLASAGLDAVVSTDHRTVVDLQPSFDAIGNGLPVGDLPALVPGIEAAVRDYGMPSGKTDRAHFNVFPLLDESHAPLPGEEPETIASLYDAYRARQAEAPFPGVGDDVLIELNHPRGIQFQADEAPRHGAWPLFNAMGFDPHRPVGVGVNEWLTVPEPETGTTALDIEAMEILNRFSLQLYLEVRNDWFSLLNQGFRITGTGNSDSHAQQVELAGFPVNLVRAATDSGEFDLLGFTRAIEQGHVLVTTGPVVEIEVQGADGSVGLAGDDVVADGGVVVAVRVRAASWVPVDEVRLVVDGEVVERQEMVAHDGLPLDERMSWELPLDADAWILVEAGWPIDPPETFPVAGGDYGLVAPGYVPLAFTNPVFVDADGDGRWAPPGLR